MAKSSGLQEIKEFLNSKTFAIIGVSPEKEKFGNYIFKHFRDNNYRVYQIHRVAKELNGEICYNDLSSLPAKVEGLIVAVSKDKSKELVINAVGQGVKKVWLQQGSESQEAIDFCLENNTLVVYGRCILMFAEPVKSIHRFHRWLWNILGFIK